MDSQDTARNARAEVLEDLENLDIPLGDIVVIDFFYNDTDDSEG